jgi:cell division protein FtsN
MISLVVMKVLQNRLEVVRMRKEPTAGKSNPRAAMEPRNRLGAVQMPMAEWTAIGQKALQNRLEVARMRKQPTVGKNTQ